MRIALSLILAAAVSAGTFVHTQPADRFVPLFNGRNLDGWENVNCAPETWSVRDGLIHCTGKPICELRTARMYENFILELEYRHLVAGGNAGVFIWGDALTARGQPFVRSIEIQVLDGRNTANYTSHGDIFPIHGARMTPDRPHPAGWARSLPSERRARPAGEWNHYRITAKDGRVTLAVNGKEVSGGYDASPRKGYIHLESEGGVVEWRNLRIQELPSSGALAPEHVAQEDEGFRTLYTGTDFRGWQYPKGHEGHWVSNDWIITYDGRSQAEDKNLWTEQAFGDMDVSADWRWPGEEAGGTELPILLSGLELPEAARTAVAGALSEKPAGDEWHRARLSLRGGRLTLQLDGAELVRNVAVPGGAVARRVGLAHSDRPIEFANIFVRELTATGR